jgi:hypothetical protein
MKSRDVRDHNRRAWDLRVERGNRWTVPVTADDVDRARRGDIDISQARACPRFAR